MITGPIGTIIGYVIAASIQNTMSWKYAFIAEVLFLIPCFIKLSLIDPKYMDTKGSGVLIRDHQR